MSKNMLSLERLSGLNESQRKFLSGEKGIMDIAALTAIARDHVYGRPGLITGLRMDEGDFDRMMEEALDILRKECWACFQKLDEGWHPMPSPPGALFPETDSGPEDDGPEAARED